MLLFTFAPNGTITFASTLILVMFLMAGVMGHRTKLAPTSVTEVAPEFILTFLTSLVYFHCLAQDQFEAAVMVGLSHLAVLSAVEAWVNPLRAFGPAFLSNQFGNHWVVWVGPILGAVSGGFCFQYIFYENIKTDKPTAPVVFAKKYKKAGVKTF